MFPSASVAEVVDASTDAETRVATECTGRPKRPQQLLLPPFSVRGGGGGAAPPATAAATSATPPLRPPPLAPSLAGARPAAVAPPPGDDAAASAASATAAAASAARTSLTDAVWWVSPAPATAAAEAAAAAACPLPAPPLRRKTPPPPPRGRRPPLPGTTTDAVTAHVRTATGERQNEPPPRVRPAPRLGRARPADCCRQARGRPHRRRPNDRHWPPVDDGGDAAQVAGKGAAEARKVASRRRHGRRRHSRRAAPRRRPQNRRHSREGGGARRRLHRLCLYRLAAAPVHLLRPGTNCIECPHFIGYSVQFSHAIGECAMSASAVFLGHFPFGVTGMQFSCQITDRLSCRVSHETQHSHMRQARDMNSENASTKSQLSQFSIVRTDVVSESDAQSMPFKAPLTCLLGVPPLETSNMTHLCNLAH